ncbi:unnamed protein product [Heligmosomoides polygyrus]|uniref:Nesprin-1 n=1 Tax=Heligmosomoides polygyrus TaxID=6339 RepID=A0A183GC75_HELPZ|nr:unnamed protein product [Heligmosomoides polygyrus]
MSSSSTTPTDADSVKEEQRTTAESQRAVAAEIERTSTTTGDAAVYQQECAQTTRAMTQTDPAAEQQRTTAEKQRTVAAENQGTSTTTRDVAVCQQERAQTTRAVPQTGKSSTPTTDPGARQQQTTVAINKMKRSQTTKQVERQKPPGETKYDLWQDFCSRGAAAFQQTQEKLSKLAKNEAKEEEQLWCRLRKIDDRTEAMERTMKEHHQYVQLNLQPTTVTLQEEHLQQMLSILTAETTKISDSAHESIETAKNSILNQMSEMDKEISECHFEIQKRLEEVQRKQQVLPEILAVVKSIEARLDHQNDSHLPPAERPADPEDEESVNSLVIMDALSGDSDSQNTPDNLEDDKAIREGIAAKRKTLTNIQTRVAQLNQQFEEENRRRDRSPNRIHKLKVEKTDGIAEKEVTQIVAPTTAVPTSQLAIPCPKSSIAKQQRSSTQPQIAEELPSPGNAAIESSC